MTVYREVRATFDQNSIVVYQAYRPEIADAAIKAGRFVAPFSFGRMTWIKPSFLWLMERSNWGRKAGQERILEVRIRRSGWDKALSEAVLTSYESRIHGSTDAWRAQFEKAIVHVQWDPERSIHGSKLEHRSIQVGISREIIGEYVEHWIVELKDVTLLVNKIRRLCEEGHFDKAKRLLPNEKRYEVCQEVGQRLGIHQQ
jgi:hypothetical protein